MLPPQGALPLLPVCRAPGWAATAAASLEEGLEVFHLLLGAHKQRHPLVHLRASGDFQSARCCMWQHAGCAGGSHNLQRLGLEVARCSKAQGLAGGGTRTNVQPEQHAGHTTRVDLDQLL